MKTWWKGEAVVVHSNRWKIIENDLLQALQQTCRDLRNTYKRPITKKKGKK